MIGLKVGDIWLDLRSPSIRMLERGIIQAEENDFNGITLDFRVARNEKSDLALKFIGEPTSVVQDNFVEADLWWGGSLFSIGFLYVIEVEARDYRCSFVKNTIPEYVMNKKLSEVVRGDLFEFGFIDNTETVKNYAFDRAQTTGIPTWTKGNVDAWDNVKFPMIANEAFYADLNSDFVGLVNWYNKQFDGMMANFVANENEDNSEIDPQSAQVKNITCLSPQFFAGYILEKIMRYARYEFGGSVVEDVRFSRALVFNNRAMDNFQYPGYYSARGLNILLEQTSDLDAITLNMPKYYYFRDYLQYGVHATSEFGYKCRQDGVLMFRFTIRTAAPVSSAQFDFNYTKMETVSGVVGSPVAVNLSQGSLNGQDFVLEFKTTNMRVGDLVIFNFKMEVAGPVIVTAESVLMEVFSPEVNYGGGPPEVIEEQKKLNIFQREVQVGDHVPDVTVRQFLQALKKGFNCKFEFSRTSRRVDINYIEDAFSKKPVADYTDLALANPIVSWRKSERFSFKMQHEGDLRAEAWSGNVGEGGQVIEMPFSVMAMSFDYTNGVQAGYDTQAFLMRILPIIDWRGKSELFTDDFACPLKFYNWQGPVNGASYPFANSNGRWNYNGALLSGFYDLRLFALVQSFWQNYIDAIQSNRSFLYGLDGERFLPMLVDKYSPFTIVWTMFILEELSYSLTVDGLKDVEIKGLRQ
jgi:hypothetical protein